MTNNKIFIVVIILAIVILGFVGYYAILPNISPGQSQGMQGGTSGRSFAGGITEAHFETFPAGTQIKQGVTGTNTNIFKKDDLVSISGQSNVSTEVKLTIKIFDSNGNPASNTGWFGNEIKIRFGTFGFGSIAIPQIAGNYILKIYLNNQEAKDMPFTVQ